MQKENYIVTIIGRPNVGKSTLFNRLIGERLAITTDVAGTTRDRLYEIVNWQGKEFILVDTAGLEYAFEERFKEDIQSQIEIAIDEADLILFLTDGKTDITDLDWFAAKKLKKANRNVILAVNKIDSLKEQDALPNFYKLGFGEPISISALSGKGTGDLLDKIVQELSKIPAPKLKKEKPEEKKIRITILGRPNVGKSTLLNAILKKERAMISEIPGTTRDIIETEFNFNKNKIAIVDTAGLRRRGKIGKVAGTGKKTKIGSIEKYSALRAMRSASEADIILLVIDATEEITAQDQHLAGLAKDLNKGIILVVNKIDAVPNLNISALTSLLKRKFEFIPFASFVFVSALSGKNVQNILELVLKIAEERSKKVRTHFLNNVLEKIVIKNPPVGIKNFKPKLKYITQTGTNPPTFTIFGTQTDKIHFSYLRFLENRIRENFDFSGTSIKIEFREKEK